MAKSKSDKDPAGNRKLAAGNGRTKRKSGGEPQKKRTTPRGSGRRAGSSKEHDYTPGEDPLQRSGWRL
jgi:hypothetical protein